MCITCSRQSANLQVYFIPFHPLVSSLLYLKTDSILIILSLDSFAQSLENGEKDVLHIAAPLYLCCHCHENTVSLASLVRSVFWHNTPYRLSSKLQELMELCLEIGKYSPASGVRIERGLQAEMTPCEATSIFNVKHETSKVFCSAVVYREAASSLASQDATFFSWTQQIIIDERLLNQSTTL